MLLHLQSLEPETSLLLFISSGVVGFLENDVCKIQRREGSMQNRKRTPRAVLVTVCKKGKAQGERRRPPSTVQHAERTKMF